MPVSKAASIQEHFADLSDPRRRKVTYPLINIVTMALCAVMSGADDFVAIADWAETKKEWLAKFLDMSAGVPSHDRFNAILGALKPASPSPSAERLLELWRLAMDRDRPPREIQLIVLTAETLALPSAVRSSLFAEDEDSLERTRAVERLLERLVGGLGKTPYSDRMHRTDVLRMIKRRARAANFPAPTCCHTFRATGITAYESATM